jgi:hypothetical protein
MRAGTGVSPHMRDQFIWNKLSPSSPSVRRAGGAAHRVEPTVNAHLWRSHPFPLEAVCWGCRAKKQSNG